MSKFFRIKSKPKINIVRRDTNKHAGLNADNVGNPESNALQEEELGKALDQQLSKKCEKELHSSPSLKFTGNEPTPTSFSDLPTSLRNEIENNVSDHLAKNDISNKNDNENKEIGNFEAPLPTQKLRVDFSKIETDENVSNSNIICIDSQNKTDADLNKQLILDLHHKGDSTSNDILERPIPPPSPTKINRIKAVPKFSDSDAGRHHGRTRNISVCSVTTLNEGVVDNIASNKEVFPPAQKKISRSEQSKKLAEARREFQKRFGEACPDKQKLKMIDLIFYNPVTNPMADQNEKEGTPTIKTLSEKEEPKNEKDQEVDDPMEEFKNTADSEAPEKDKDNDTQDDEMPVPQIKIGPNGEIILDEQSLVIENKEVQKQRDDIQMSDVIDGDSKTSYGVFKRSPRSKDWNHKETLRFYKALNVIGSDFSMMVELFPNRSRRELKAKFKKEEKVNGNLISKALTIPCCYNYDQLKQDFRAEQEEEKELQRLAEEEAKAKRDKLQMKKEKKIKQSMAREKFLSKRIIFDSGSSEDEDERVKVTQKVEDLHDKSYEGRNAHQDFSKNNATEANCSGADDEFVQNFKQEIKSVANHNEKYKKESKELTESKKCKKRRVPNYNEKDNVEDTRITSEEEGFDSVKLEDTSNVKPNKNSNNFKSESGLKRKQRFKPNVALKRTKKSSADKKTNSNDHNVDSGSSEDECLNVTQKGAKIAKDIQNQPKDKTNKEQDIFKDDETEANISDINCEFIENPKMEKENERIISEEEEVDAVESKLTSKLRPYKATQSYSDNNKLTNASKSEFRTKRKQRFKPNISSQRTKKSSTDQETNANHQKDNLESDSDNKSDESNKGAFVPDEYLEEEDEEESESEEEATMPILLPTRFGRLPKSRNIEQAQLVSMPPPRPPGLMQMRNRRISSMSSTISSESSLENAMPGSIMVMTEDGFDGKPVYKSYMVTPEGSLTPLNVESDIIAKVIDYKSNEVTDSDREEDSGVIPPREIEDTNVTIPANNESSEDEALDLTIHSVSANTDNNIAKMVNYTVLRTKNGVPVGDNKKFSIQIVNEVNSEITES